MKAFVKTVVIAAALAAPVVTFAQSTSPVTRAQVRSELAQLEQAGYRGSAGDASNYPVGIQQALARVARESAAATEYGGVSGGSSASGAKGTSGAGKDVVGMKPVYLGQ